MSPAFELSYAHGNYEFAAYTVSIDVITQLFASRPLPWQIIRSKYTALRPLASSGFNIMLSIREFWL
jgi:hypothetical protein